MIQMVGDVFFGGEVHNLARAPNYTHSENCCVDFHVVAASPPDCPGNFQAKQTT